MTNSRVLVSICSCLCLSLMTVSGARAEAVAPELSVLGPSLLTISGSQGSDTASGYFSLLNPGKHSVTVSAHFQAATSARAQLRPIEPDVVPAGSAERLKVTFSGLEGLDEKVEGQLIVSGGANPVSEAVEIDPAPQPSAAWPELAVFVSLAVAIFLALAVVGAAKSSELKLLGPAPGAKWSFESWTTTLVAVGAVLGATLGEVTFPEFPTQISKSSLIDLNLLFGGLVVLGPFVFQALRRPRFNIKNEEAGLWGWNLTLLIACTITLWAVLGQLFALGLLCWELSGGGSVGIALIAVMGVTGLLAACYFWFTVSSMVTNDWSETVSQSVAVAAVAPATPATPTAGPARHHWPLL